MDLDIFDSLLNDTGLTRLGAFHPRSGDGVPGIDDDTSDATLILLGNAGPDMWRVFSSARLVADEPDPLDNWSRRTVADLASRIMATSGIPATALFPFDGPPYFPFQQWALKSGDVHPSPFGPLIHQTFGLWHAYRGAILLTEKIALPPSSPRPSPCDSCPAKPCLTTCPVEAFGSGGYDVPACIGHLASGDGEACFRRGCLARAACPVAPDYAYQEDQARFHLEKFFAVHR